MCVCVCVCIMCIVFIKKPLPVYSDLIRTLLSIWFNLVVHVLDMSYITSPQALTAAKLYFLKVLCLDNMYKETTIVNCMHCSLH